MNDNPNQWYLSGDLSIDGNATLKAPDKGIYSLQLSRIDESGREHRWAFWHMNSEYRKNSLEIWEYKTDSSGKNCTGDSADGAMCTPRLVIAEGGNVGIGPGTLIPEANLHVSGGALLGSVSAGGNPSSTTSKFPYPYETVGTLNPAHNLRLHSVNIIAFHTGNSQFPTVHITSSGDLDVSGKITGKGSFVAGMIVMWFGNSNTIPAGWVLCDGNNGTPNLSGRFIVGLDNNDPDYNSVGRAGGEKWHAISVAELPAHSHSGETNDTTQGISLPQGGGIGGSHVLAAAAHNAGWNDGALRHTHSFTTNNTGGNQPFDNRPPYYVLAYIMYKG